MNNSHLGINFHNAPLGKPNDGMNDVIFIGMDKSKKNLLNYMLTKEKGAVF